MVLFLRFWSNRRNPLYLSTILVMKSYKILFSGFFLLLLITSCSKDVDDLPAATQTGANTFGAKVNGEFWVPAKFGIIPADNLLKARYSSPESILITANNFSKSPNETSFEIQITGVTGPGTYYLNQNVIRPTRYGYGFFEKRRFTPEEEYQTSNHFTGSVTITRLDNVNKIVSGTFEFNAESLSNPGQSIQVTEGRFDIKYE